MEIREMLENWEVCEVLADKVIAYIDGLYSQFRKNDFSYVKELDTVKMIPPWIKHEQDSIVKELDFFNAIQSDASRKLSEMDGYKYNLKHLLESDDRFSAGERTAILEDWENVRSDNVTKMDEDPELKDAASMKERFLKASKIYFRARNNSDERGRHLNKLATLDVNVKFLIRAMTEHQHMHKLYLMEIREMLENWETCEVLADKVIAYIDGLISQFRKNDFSYVKELDTVKMIPRWIKHEQNWIVNELDFFNAIHSDASIKLIEMDGYKYNLKHLLESDDRFSAGEKTAFLEDWENVRSDNVNKMDEDPELKDAASMKARFLKASKIYFRARNNSYERGRHLSKLATLNINVKFLIRAMTEHQRMYKPSEVDRSSQRWLYLNRCVGDSSSRDDSSFSEDEMQQSSQKMNKRVRDSSSSPEDEMQYHRSRKDSDGSLISC